jgi:hypothetical protein
VDNLPIKPIKCLTRSLYPDDWDAIALAVKHSAKWCCEACDRPCRKPGESFEALIERLNWAFVPSKPGSYVLTVAHLNHIPADCRPENLKALCTVCHCRYDLKAMPTKKRLKREFLGQLSLFSDLAGQGKDLAKVQKTIFEEGDRS